MRQSNPVPRDLPPAVGLRASVKLCRISSFISANSYRLTPRSFAPNSSVSYFDEALQRLADWYLALPKELQLGEESLSRDRAAVCLHLAYNQVCNPPLSLRTTESGRALANHATFPP